MKTHYILFFIIFISCNSKVTKNVSEAKSLIEKEIYFEDYTLIDSLLQNKYLLISFVDSGKCTPCSLQKVQSFNANKERLKKLNIEVLLIINNTDNTSIEKTLKDLNINFSTIVDKKGRFKTNNLIPSDTKYHDFIIDKSYKVFWVGSPFFNIESWEKFNHLIKIKNNINALQ